MMDIKKILEESGKDLYMQDLDFFEAELDTGDSYDDTYRSVCKLLISQLRNWKKYGDDYDPKKEEQKTEKEVKKAGKSEKRALGKMQLDITEIDPTAASLSTEESIEKSIRAMRKSKSYKQLFKDYIKKHTEIDADYVDEHFTFFEPYEIDAIVSLRQMGEEFLEKYFGAISSEKIARYQLFSESFFMKHYAQLDADIVLTHGKNEWKNKEKRSNQLDVFLRLKGVKK